jgi:hypothetical protein
MKRPAAPNPHQETPIEGGSFCTRLEPSAAIGEIKLPDALHPIQKSYKLCLFD